MPVYVPAKIKQLNNDSYKLIDAADIDGSVPALTGSGPPTSVALQGTLYWDTTNQVAWINSDGATGWVPLGGGSSINSQTTIIETATDVDLDSGISSETTFTTS